MKKKLTGQAKTDYDRVWENKLMLSVIDSIEQQKKYN